MSASSTSRSDVFSPQTAGVLRLRWVVVGVVLGSNILNFLDRQLMAALAPTLKSEFHLTNTQYGTLVSAFSFVYAVATPFAGMFLDSIGLNAGITTSVALWSLAGVTTGLTNTFGGLLLCRSALGLGEAAGLPFLSKVNATYLSPSEWGLASAVGSLAVTVGISAAPLFAAFMAPRYGWRSVFVTSGLLGFIWLVLWQFVKRIGRPTPTKGSKNEEGAAGKAPYGTILRDRRMWRIVVAYPLVMAVFILWLNWTTVYLVQEHHLSSREANTYFAWIPSIFAGAGGFFNGWLAFRWIRRGTNGLAARTRICTLCAPMFLITAAIPLMPSAGLAIGGVAVGLLSCQCVVGSLNIMPVDLFGPGRAAFSVSLLACAYSLMQAFVHRSLASLLIASASRQCVSLLQCCQY